MNKGAVKYIIKLLLQRVLGLLIFLLGSCWILTFRAAVYFSFYFATTILSCVVMYRVNPVTLAQRNKANTDSPKWDKILLGLYWILAFFVIYLVAGLESGRIPQEVGVLFWIGIALQVFVTALTLWALSVNTFLESTARIQNDRRQTVCRNGPYKFIRHPTYTAIIMWCVSIVMIFQTILVSIVAAVVAAIIIIRTNLEDIMLKKELNGYEEYTHNVKYRLFPFVW